MAGVIYIHIIHFIQIKHKMYNQHIYKSKFTIGGNGQRQDSEYRGERRNFENSQR